MSSAERRSRSDASCMVVDAYSVLEVVANNKSARRRETRGADLGPKGCMYDNVSSFDFNAWYEVSLMMTEIGRNGERGREKDEGKEAFVVLV